MSSESQTSDLPAPMWNGLATGSLFMAGPDSECAVSFDGYHYDSSVCLFVLNEKGEDHYLIDLDLTRLRALAAWATEVADAMQHNKPGLPYRGGPIPQWRMPQ